MARRKSPARLYFDAIRHHHKVMHTSLEANLSGLYMAAKRGTGQFDDPAFSDAKEILGAALQAESNGRAPYARLLGVIGLKILSQATKRNAIGVRRGIN